MSAEARAADTWWGTLTDDRRAAIHRWVDKRPTVTDQPPEQGTIFDELGEPPSE